MEHKPLSAPLEDASQRPLIDVGSIDRQVKASSLKKVGQLIDAHPQEALAIVRTWMYQEA
ncbi:MAG: hypothetical protein IIC04_04075 [Proteobacteria bacterium]|nr:hypothetical protein [Pseudomonadota bacterium]